MPMLFFTEARTPAELKTEIVTDIRNRAELARIKMEAAEKRRRAGETERYSLLNEELNALADHWETAVIGNPQKKAGE